MSEELKSAAEALVAAPEPAPVAEPTVTMTMAQFEKAVQMRAEQDAWKVANSPPPTRGEHPFAGIGAPNPISVQDRETNPNNWDADTIARYRDDGSFLKRIEKHKQTLPGGSNGLFKNKGRGRKA